MRAFAAAIALLALLAPAANAAVGRVVTIALPHAAAADEDIVLRVRAGILRRGDEIDVYSRRTLLGTVSPFAVRGRHEVGTYSIPLPDHLRHARRIVVRLVLTQAGRAARAPTTQEVRGVTVAYVGR